MTYVVNSPRTIYFLLPMMLLLFSLPTITSAQAANAIVPTISLILNDDEERSTEFSCDYSIADISLPSGSVVAQNDSVSATFNYTLSNRPTGVRVEVRPALITSLEDLDNFLDTAGLSLNPQLTRLVDFESTDSDISGSIAIERINDGSNIGLNGRTFNDLVVFITLSRQNEESGIITVIGSDAFDCASRVSETVNWMFTR